MKKIIISAVILATSMAFMACNGNANKSGDAGNNQETTIEATQGCPQATAADGQACDGQACAGQQGCSGKCEGNECDSATCQKGQCEGGHCKKAQGDSAQCNGNGNCPKKANAN